jgi:hypothetical protein
MEYVHFEFTNLRCFWKFGKLSNRAGPPIQTTGAAVIVATAHRFFAAYEANARPSGALLSALHLLCSALHRPMANAAELAAACHKP